MNGPDAIATVASAEPETKTKRANTKLSRLLPLTIFLLIVALLGIGLFMDPRLVPSPLIGKPVPEFSLPAVQGRNSSLARENLTGAVSMVNVFASWCVACRQEHPLLMELAKQAVVPIHGLNYKDKPKEAAAWLDSLGDPYIRTGADIDGRVGIDLGVYGVPETFIIDQGGRIAYKHIGPIARKDWEETLKPLIEDLRNRKVKALITENL